jgi:uncharacterized protein YqeY
MKSNRGNDTAGKKRHRRGEDELIAALQVKIEALERKKHMRALRQDPTLKLADRVLKQLRKAESKFQVAGRLDLANSTKAAAISIQQAIGVHA